MIRGSGGGQRGLTDFVIAIGHVNGAVMYVRLKTVRIYVHLIKFACICADEESLCRFVCTAGRAQVRGVRDIADKVLFVLSKITVYQVVAQLP